jgi:prepilin-type N-terminal cleavage/methylation domain-containing protein
MSDIYCECWRCRNKHWESERESRPALRYQVKVNDLVCPRCGAKSYYRVAPDKWPGKRTGPVTTRGFTLIELLIAIAAIGILLAVIFGEPDPGPAPAPVIKPPHYYELCIDGLTFIEAIDDGWRREQGNYALVQLIGTDGLPVPCGSSSEVEQ